MQANQTTTEPVRYGLRQAIATIKAAVPIEQVAVEYGEFKLLGNGRLLGRCLAPDHTDRTPSMTVFTDTQRFKCFGCQISGDVIDLEELGGRHLEAWTAVVALSTRYGVELPERPTRWFDRQREKHDDHTRIVGILADAYQRRLHRIFAPIILEGIEDHDERFEESERLWEGFGRVARGMARRRTEGPKRG